MMSFYMSELFYCLLLFRKKENKEKSQFFHQNACIAGSYVTSKTSQAFPLAHAAQKYDPQKDANKQQSKEQYCRNGITINTIAKSLVVDEKGGGGGHPSIFSLTTIYISVRVEILFESSIGLVGQPAGRIISCHYEGIVSAVKKIGSKSQQ